MQGHRECWGDEAGGIQGDAEETGFLTPEKRSPERESNCCLQLPNGAAQIGWSQTQRCTAEGGWPKAAIEENSSRVRESKRVALRLAEVLSYTDFFSGFYDTVRQNRTWISLTQQKYSFCCWSMSLHQLTPEQKDMEFSDGLSDGKAELGAASQLIPIIIPDSFAAFAGWVTRWSNCPICHSRLETTGLSSAPSLGSGGDFLHPGSLGFSLLGSQVPAPADTRVWTNLLLRFALWDHIPCQGTGTAYPAKGPSTPAAFLHPHPTSAPWSVPPLGSPHLGGGCCLKAAPRNVSMPRFQVSSKLLGDEHAFDSTIWVQIFTPKCPQASAGS